MANLLEDIARLAGISDIEDSVISSAEKPIVIGPAELLKSEYPEAPPNSWVCMFIYKVLSEGGRVTRIYATHAAIQEGPKVAKILGHSKEFEGEYV